MGVSKEKIIQASIEILNQSGIDGLTTRELAKKLNIKSASLYWHIKNKQDLYGLIAEQISSEIGASHDLSEAKEYLLEINMKYRAKLLGIRDSVEIFARSIPNTPYRAEIIKNTLDCLSRIGIAGKNCVTAANLLNNYVLSFVADEILFKSIPLEELSNIGDAFGVREANDYDEQFLYGLNVLFAGFEAVK